MPVLKSKAGFVGIVGKPAIAVFRLYLGEGVKAVEPAQTKTRPTEKTDHTNGHGVKTNGNLQRPKI